MHSYTLPLAPTTDSNRDSGRSWSLSVVAVHATRTHEWVHVVSPIEWMHACWRYRWLCRIECGICSTFVHTTTVYPTALYPSLVRSSIDSSTPSSPPCPDSST